MKKRIIQVLVVVAAITAMVILVNIFNDKSAEAPSEQNNDAPTQTSEQTNDDTEGVTPVQPDINTQEFIITNSNVSCSSSTVNGVTANNCSGNVRVVPRAQSDMDSGLYKINEQTKLLHNGQTEDLNNLQQLAQNRTVVRLKLSGTAQDTLAEISY